MDEHLLLQRDTDVFERQYHSVRLNEQRIYSNEEIALLPEISPSHIHYTEWTIRKKSCNRFLDFLRKKNKKLNILEAGCGNGWLAAKISEIENASVTGIDINRIELMQAVTVFEKRESLRFIYGDLNAPGLAPHSFDVIVFASSIQYFSSLENIISTALLLLNKNGEIHIFDTPFYNERKIANASKRTKAYYASLGFREMSDYYFHHSIKELGSFGYTILYSPQSVFNKWKKKEYPFHWIMIKPKK
jgi:SAM-dependent methyltransferase